MRKAVSLLIALTIVMVSSIPLVPEAPACSMPAAMTHGGMLMHHAAGIEASGKVANHADHCRIECACGCHQSIDSLPHLLAPHSVALDSLHVEMLATDASVDAVPALQARLLVFPTPPPKQS